MNARSAAFLRGVRAALPCGTGLRVVAVLAAVLAVFRSMMAGIFGGAGR